MAPTAHYDGHIAEPVDGHVLHWVAAAPPGRNGSFTGSALPFANARQAFYETPNRGTAHVGPGGAFRIVLSHGVNTFYAKSGAEEVPPTVFVMYHSGGRERRLAIRLPAHHRVPYRSLAYPAGRTSASFYGEPGALLPVRSQDQIIRQAEYPCPSHVGGKPDFWGLRPPV